MHVGVNVVRQVVVDDVRHLGPHFSVNRFDAPTGGENLYGVSVWLRRFCVWFRRFNV